MSTNEKATSDAMLPVSDFGRSQYGTSGAPRQAMLNYGKVLLAIAGADGEEADTAQGLDHIGVDHAGGTFQAAHQALAMLALEEGGEAAQQHIAADRRFYECDRDARAIIAERTAAATALSRKRQAMAGPGGRSLVKLHLAESLHETPILIIPKLDGAALQQLDLNQLFRATMQRPAD